ncbi:TPA: lipase [Providencia rettgeri]|uniref:SGNH/GDSL hydrolase family protein n=1 Tax=Providencia sp. PROV129 TaxID=2949839 RepID=UPI0023494263|nr:SGNH/GDSL hydrolase family protein [Providencia sp. PROV129]HEC8328228.1 lipase [Providencia rettgeri]
MPIKYLPCIPSCISIAYIKNNSNKNNVVDAIKSIQVADDVDGSLFGKNTEKRIPGPSFQLTREYLSKLNAKQQTQSVNEQNSKNPENKGINYFDRVIVIGDSLSDSEGRMHRKSGGLLPRSRQYYEGKFTNGSTWIEFLVNPVFMKSHSFHNGKVEKSKVELINRSEGGSPCASYSSDPKFLFLSNMKKQQKGLTFDEKDLSIIFFGANDYMTYGKSDVDKVINSHKKHIKKMINNGAKNILVMGLPDLSEPPAIKTTSPQTQRKIQNLSIEHNNKLQTLVNIFKLNKNININYFNVNNVMKKIINIVGDINKNSPGAYNMKTAFSDGYIRRDRPHLEVDPHYIFIDDVHPTQEVHNIIAMELHNFILEKYK